MFSNFGRTLVLLRELQGKSQAKLAREAGIGKSQLSKYETGKELPKLESLAKVLSALGIGLLDLFSTLEVVDRRDKSLHEKMDHPLDWMRPRPEFQSDLLSEETCATFNQIFSDLLTLHQRVLGELLRLASRPQKGEP